MAKPDFPALLPPGMHSLTLQDLQSLAVARFPQDMQRYDLHHKLTAWAGALLACGVGGTLWLDGSFLTEKPSPEDVDCVLWNPHWVNAASATLANEQQVRHLLDHAAAKNLFRLDLYVEQPAPGVAFHREAYWRGVLGFGHDRMTAKGFAEVNL